MNKIQEIPYQVDSAEQIYRTLYGENYANCYLLADEVGLGKTITAAMVIEKLIEEKRKSGETVRIGYICANLALAEHNQKKLTKTINEKQKDIIIQKKTADRLSMSFKSLLRNSVSNDKKPDVIIDAITPVTSLKVLSAGTLPERCWAYDLLFGDENKMPVYMRCACLGKGKKSEGVDLSDEEKNKLNDSFRKEINKRKFQKKELDEFKAVFNQLFAEEFAENEGRIVESSVKSMLTVSSNYLTRKKDSKLEVLMILAKLAQKYQEQKRDITIIGRRFDKIKEGNNNENVKKVYKENGGNSKGFEKWFDDCIASLDSEEQLLGEAEKIIKDIPAISEKKRFGECVRRLTEYIDREERIRWLVCWLEYWVKSEQNTLQCSEKKLIDACIALCNAKVNKQTTKEEYKYNAEEHRWYLDAIKKKFCDITCTEVLKLARKVMAVAGLRIREVDLFIADEIQNYSEILVNAAEKEARTETELVIKEVLFNGKNKVLMLSATPFRYRTKLCELENRNRDEDSDSYQTNYEEQVFTKEEQYLQRETDIYAEFEKIIGYLKEDFKFDEWKRLCREKYERVHQITDSAGGCVKIGDDKDPVAEIVELQNKMLKETHVSRMERYMSGINNSFEEDATIVNWRDIGLSDLMCVPDMGLSIVDSVEFEEKCISSKRKQGKPLVLRYQGNLYFCPNDKEDLSFYCPEDSVLEDLEWKAWEADEQVDEGDYYDAEYEIVPGMEGIWHSDSDTMEEYYIWEVAQISLNRLNTKSNLSRLEKVLEKNTTRMDYLKGVPAFLSYRQGYRELNSISDKTGKCILNVSDVKEFKELELGNARIKKLFKKVFDEEEGHKLLFIPPIMADRRGLGGVFKNKTGFSKRLFFTDYNMAPKSLATLLTYEANRRVCKDLKERLNEEILPPKVPLMIAFSGSKTVTNDRRYFLNVEELTQFKLVYSYEKERSYFILKNGEGTEERISQKEIVEILLEYDKQLYDSVFGEKKEEVGFGDKVWEIYKNASPYYFAMEYLKNMKSTDVAEFCKAYYDLMTREDALRVIMAYSKGVCLFEAILQYGYDGNIFAVFEEYRELEGEDFLISFKQLGATKFNSIMTIMNGEEGYEARPLMKTGYAIGHYAGDSLSNVNKADTLERKIKAFNTPFRPFHFISTSIGQEGFDFHKYCRIIVHWSLVFNPVKFEQREGRIDRARSYANRLNVYQEVCMDLKEWKWDTAYKMLKERNKDLVKQSRGLYPEFVVLCEKYKMSRETYYYENSYEHRMLPEILQGVGYYRSLLGQTGEDTFEEAMKRFLKDKDKSKYFLNLSPQKSD